MKKITQQQLIEKSSIPSKLIRAVIRQMGGWESFTENAPDITRHGIDGGFCGFVYYNDTVSFAKRNRAVIREMAEAQASELGEDVIKMIQSFNCLKSDAPSVSEVGSALFGSKGDDNILNALAWYAGEEVSRAYCDLTEEN